MKLAKTLYERHLFILASQDVMRNMAVYRTCNGPVFVVFGKTGTVRRYLNGEGAMLSKFECSHDLCSPSDDEAEKRLTELIKHYFPLQNTKGLIIKIKKIAKKLNAKELDLDMSKRLSNWNPSVGKGKTYQELLDLGYFK